MFLSIEGVGGSETTGRGGKTAEAPLEDRERAVKEEGGVAGLQIKLHYRLKRPRRSRKGERGGRVEGRGMG